MPVLPGGGIGALVKTLGLWAFIVVAVKAHVLYAEQIIPPDDPAIALPGAWQRAGDELVTPYPGSAIHFSLMGPARVLMRSPGPDSIKLQIRADDEDIFSGVWNDSFYALDASTNQVNYAITFIAAREAGFYETNSSRLIFEGIETAGGANLLPQDSPADPERLIFIGDSITAGSVIHGREGEWHENSDASLTFALQLAQQLNADYELRGFPGAQLHELISVSPFFVEDTPLEAAGKVDWVIINAGANDRQLEAREYRNKLGELISVSRSTYPGARVLLLNFFRMTPPRWPELEKVARSFPGGDVVCIDARPYLVDYTDGHVHPGPESHRRLADALAGFFKNLPLDPRAGDDATNP